MCRCLNISRQGYYQWQERSIERTLRAKADRDLRDKICVVHAESRRTYGRIRIRRELKENGIWVNEKRIARLMKAEGLRAKAAKKFKATTDSAHHLPVAANLLDRDFVATAANEKWVGDMTYIWTGEGWLYLAVVIDLFSRRVVGWSMKNRMTSDIACEALKMAVNNRGCAAETLCHFDRGGQYASNIFQALLRNSGFKCSMSRKGNCWDNAVAESFFHTLKVEAVHDETFVTREQARNAIFDWIECFYNVKRRHSTLGYLSPANFELKQAA